jgi:hypothetical protein
MACRIQKLLLALQSNLARNLVERTISSPSRFNDELTKKVVCKYGL